MNQHQALANLHKVVQICNQGLNMNSVRENAMSNFNIARNKTNAGIRLDPMS